MSHRHVLAALLLSALLPAQTYIVSRTGGGQFTDIPPAIAAVPSGAVLRVRSGTYSAFTVQNKSLSILGDSSATVIVNADADVVLGPINASQRIVVSGLKVLFTVPAVRTVQRVEVRDAAGPVWLDDIEIAGRSVPFPDVLAQFQLQIIRSGNVHLHRCRSELVAYKQDSPPIAAARIDASFVEMWECRWAARTTMGGLGGGLPGPGVELISSRALMVDCDVLGGKGEDQLHEFGSGGGHGGPAVRVGPNSVIDIHGARSRYVGGAGGNGYGAGPLTPGGNGGDGLVLSTSRARLIGVTPQGGVRGTGTPPGANGRPFSADASSTVQQIAGQGPTATLTGTAGRGNPVASVLAANAGDLAILFLGRDPLFVPVPGVITHGGLMCTLDVIVNPVFVPASGTLTLPWQIPPEWPLDVPAWFQFVVVPAAAVPEVWASNSVPVLIKS
jgi:hypothetical protein